MPDGGETPQTVEIPPSKPVMGRPSDYNAVIARHICLRLAQGMKTREIVAELGMSQPTIYNWLFDHDEFFSLWQRARELSVEAYADQNLEAADDTSNDVLTDKNGRLVPNMAAVKRAELRINMRQWLMGKWSKRYQDKQQLEVSGTIVHELQSRMDEIQARRDRERGLIDVTPGVQSAIAGQTDKPK